MPSKRFYRLPEEKRRMIRNAALHEFARVPFEKASINQIIKEAGISRGSFYTYFEDKWDVLTCIFEESQREIQEIMVQKMEESGGDLWYVLEVVMKKSLTLASGPERASFVKNVIEHTNSDELFRGLRRKMSLDDERREKETTRWLYENYSREKMRDLSYPEFMAFIQMATVAMAIEVKAYFEGQDADYIYENYHMKLEILKQGLLTKETEEPEPAENRNHTETA